MSSAIGDEGTVGVEATGDGADRTVGGVGGREALGSSVR